MHFTLNKIAISKVETGFHATQFACWHCEYGNDIELHHIYPSTIETLQIPSQMDRMVETTFRQGKSQLVYQKAVTPVMRMSWRFV